VRDTPTERQTYSVDETARVLGISRSLAYECVKTGEIPSVRFGSRIVIPVHVVDKLIKAA
jgi:excisionase family DNA binding protein